MGAGAAKIIVKVGTGSDIIFRNTKAFRAITFKEVENTLTLNPDIQSLVIEDIKNSEIDSAIQVINNCKLQGKYVVLHTNNVTDAIQSVTSSIGELDNAVSLEDLHKKITNSIGINVGTKQQKENDTIEDEGSKEEHKQELNEALLAINDNKRYTEEVEHPTIENKEDLEGFDGIDMGSDIFETEIEKEDDLSVYKEKTAMEMANLLSNVTKEKTLVEKQLAQAMDRIKILLDIKEAIEDERDMYKGMVDTIDNDSDIIEDPVSSEDMQKVQAELQLYKGQHAEVTVQLGQVEEDLKNCQIALDNCNQQKSEALETIDKLNNQIIELREKLSTPVSRPEDLVRISELDADIQKAEGTIADLREGLSKESAARLVVMSLLSDALDGNNLLQATIDEKNVEIENNRASIQNLEITIGNTNIELQQLKEKYDKMINEQDEGVKNKDNEINQLRKDLEVNKESYRGLKSQLDIMIKSLENKENELKNILISQGTESANSAKLAETNKLLEEANKALIKSADFLKGEVDELKGKLKIANESNTSLEDSNKQLKGSVLALSRGAMAGQKKLSIECDYTGRAIIIPVFGSGSYGITTTAVSIARKIPSGSILYMDMDVSNPKADSWFGKVPIINELDGIKDALKKTGFGALVEKGVEYVIENEKLIFMRVLETKNGHIDYFSGSYTRLDLTKLLAVGFTEFINYVGNSYKYIIVDLGRLGSSDIGDALIKMFDNIAYKSVVVTLKDKFDVRAMGVKASLEKLRLDNTIWVLNIAEDTKIDSLINRSIGSAKLMIIPKVMQMYGTGQSFDKVSGTKDKLTELMDLVFN